MRRLPFHSFRLRKVAVLALAVAALGASGCGDSDDAADDTTPAVAQQTDSTQSDKPKKSKPADETAARPEPTGGPTLLGDREQASAGAAAVDDVYGDLRSAIAAGVAASDVGVADTLKAAEGADGLSAVCDLMSEAAKRRTIVYAERSAGLADVDWTCEKATGLLLRRAGRAGGLERAMRITVVGVNADGDRATATVRFGGKKGRLATIPLVKEGGTWKLGAAPGEGG